MKFRSGSFSPEGMEFSAVQTLGDFYPVLQHVSALILPVTYLIPSDTCLQCHWLTPICSQLRQTNRVARARLWSQVPHLTPDLSYAR